MLTEREFKIVVGLNSDSLDYIFGINDIGILADPEEIRLAIERLTFKGPLPGNTNAYQCSICKTREPLWILPNINSRPHDKYYHAKCLLPLLLEPEAQAHLKIMGCI